MLKPVLYLFVFVLILGGIGFAFFTMSTPNIPQQVVTKTLDPKDAFAGAFNRPVAAPVVAVPAAAPTAAPASSIPADQSAE